MIQDSNDPLNKFFNAPTVFEEPSVPAVSEVKNDLDVDFDNARKNLQEVVLIAQEAFTDLSSLSKQMQQPRAYDALSKMLSAVVIANKALVEIHKNKQDVDRPDLNSPTVTNNTLILTTAELQKRLQAAQTSLDAAK